MHRITSSPRIRILTREGFYDKKHGIFLSDWYLQRGRRIQSLKKVDVRALLLKEKKKYNIKSTLEIRCAWLVSRCSLYRNSAGRDWWWPSKASLIIDLKTAKSRIAHYIGAAQEEVLTASDNSEFKIAQSNPIFADRLKSLSFILDAKKTQIPMITKKSKIKTKLSWWDHIRVET